MPKVIKPVQKRNNKSKKDTKEQLEKRPLKRKKITNELLELSKHTHPQK